MEFPVDFIQSVRQLLGEEESKILIDSLQETPPVSIRLNPLKQIPIQATDQVAWCANGYYLSERPSFTFDPLFHAGTYYVQEASSMFLEQAIRAIVAEKPLLCLDLCASPGGKSTHLLSLLPPGSLLVANEVIRSRANVLSENVRKWGSTHAVVTNNDPADFSELNHLFDVILTDVPCSGEGMFRKDNDSIGEWSFPNVKLCSERQRRIVADVWSALKPGGWLIYSTCTYNTSENEENIHWICEELGATALSFPLEPAWGVSTIAAYNLPVHRFFPHKTRGEGFSLTLLRKEEGESRTVSRKKSKKNVRVPDVPGLVRQWMLAPEAYQFELNNDLITAIPICWLDTIKLLAEHLKVVPSAVEIATVKGKDLIPHFSLAFSSALNKEAFPQCELSWKEAVMYLRKEVFPLPEAMPIGYVLVCYKGFPLGFVKNLQGRANNLYPQEWRIRSSYLPEQNFTL
ncbi:MAG: rRNA cytosine-C5-methyltransferase [Bacteroidales bacterium]|nr:rRNA cytosine-C5-methyltransferase [Bacteroidales bacterium]